MKIKYLFLALFLFVSAITAQTIYTQKDVDICNNKFEYAVSKDLAKQPINEVLLEIGKTFLNLDYEANTLEKGDKEQLVIHLSGLDCYTFFESSLVFARSIKEGKTTFENYQKELTNIRYRDGKINGYPSRLHYASDWLYDNDKRGNVKDITKEIGGIPFEKEINFMSTHVDSYKQLEKNPEFVAEIKKIEDDINKHDYYYVPENYIECVEDKIHNGDIILITASLDGLDISHTGIAVKMDDSRIHFMHAPIVGEKIQITEKPLGDYVKGLKRHMGILVARPLEPKK
jgi:hypothetical protein